MTVLPMGIGEVLFTRELMSASLIPTSVASFDGVFADRP